jgi:hypothetical protein
VNSGPDIGLEFAITYGMRTLILSIILFTGITPYGGTLLPSAEAKCSCVCGNDPNAQNCQNKGTGGPAPCKQVFASPPAPKTCADLAGGVGVAGPFNKIDGPTNGALCSTGFPFNVAHPNATITCQGTPEASDPVDPKL